MSSLWQKYNAIPAKGRLWIGVSTMIVAYGGMQLTDYMYEKDLEKQAALAQLSSTPSVPSSASTEPLLSDHIDIQPRR